MDKKVLRTAFIGERLFSFFIDYIIMFFIVGFSIALLIQIDEKLSWISLIVGVIFILLKDIFKGQSIGKRIFKIQIRDEIDIRKKIRVKKLILRNITTFIWPLDLIYMLFNKNNQKLGDRLLGTTVVKLTTNKEHNEEEVIAKLQESSTKNKVSKKSLFTLITIIIIVVVLFAGGIIFTIISVMKNSGAYKKAVYQIENSKKVMNQTGKIEGYGYFPTGSVLIENGLGTAEFVIKVTGEKKDIHVYVKLYKELGEEWTVKNLKVLD